MNPQADALRATGFQAMQAGNLEQAAQFFQQAAGHEPENYDTYAYLGAVYARQNNYESARRAFGRAVQIQPSSSRARFNLGVAHEKAGDIEAARVGYESALGLDHRNEQAKAALKKLPAKVVKLSELAGFGTMHLAGAHAETIEDQQADEFKASSLSPAEIAALSGFGTIHLAGAHSETIGDEGLAVAHVVATDDDPEKEEFHASSLTPQEIAAISMGTTKIH